MQRLWYYYDGSGICGVEYNGSVYYFQKNLQGDVTRVYDGNGNLAAQYVYDAWGNHKVLNANGTEITDESFIGNVNPIRYRGYYYDTDSGLYYLQSRYYDPEVGRFINADDVAYIQPDVLNGSNLYAYCGNNPVMYVDPTGTAWWRWLIGGLILAATAVLTVVTAGGFAAAGTAILSVFTATMAPTALSAVFAGALVGSVALGAAGLAIGGLSGDNGWSWDNAAHGFMWGSIIGAVVGAAWSGMHYALQNAGKMAIKTEIKNLVNNPLDEFVTRGPKDGAISAYMRSISQTGNYGQIFAKRIGKGVFEIANGHHRVAALIKLGYKYVKIFLV